MARKKDFQSIVNEMQQLEKISQYSYSTSMRQSSRSKYTVKGFLEIQKSLAYPQDKMKNFEHVLQPTRPTVMVRARLQPSQAAISQMRSKVVQNISVDDVDQGSLQNTMNKTQIFNISQSHREENSISKMQRRTRGQFSFFDEKTVQEKLMMGISRQSRESPPRPPTQQNLPQLPTRRAYMHPPGTGEDWLLGAGADPLLKELQFSQLAGNGAALFSARFQQPKNAQVRLPPLLDQFSHTLASPISTQKFNLPPSARIGQNYSPRAMCILIDYQTKNISLSQQKGALYSNISFSAQPYLLQPIATDKEELEFVQNPQSDIRLKQKVYAKVQCYKRYQLYIQNEIGSQHIAPIRQHWINKILDQVPAFYADLSDEAIKELVDKMLNEVNELYFDSIRKSIIDYILMEDEEKRRLGIMQTFFTVEKWGERISKKVMLDNNFKDVRQNVGQRLLSYSQISMKILNDWELNLKQYTLLALPKKSDQPQRLEDFNRAQMERIQNVRQLLRKEWIPQIFEQYLSHFAELKQDFPLMTKEELELFQKHFFLANSTLLGKLIRKLVTSGISKYTEFFKQFEITKFQELSTVIEEQRSQIKECAWFPTFLMIQIKETKISFEFSDAPQEIKQSLLQVFDEIVRVTQGIPRPEEHSLTKKEKVLLAEVQSSDPWFQDCHYQIECIIEANVGYAYELLTIYNKYTFLLKEMEKVVSFIQSKQQTGADEIYSPLGKIQRQESKVAVTPLVGAALQRSIFNIRKDEFIKEVLRYQDLYNEISQELPFYVMIGFVQVDGREIKRRLLQICNELQDYMFSQVLDFILRRSNEITKDIGYLIENISAIPENTKALIDLEMLIDRIRNKEEKVLSRDFGEIAAWTFLLINQRIKFSQEDLKVLHQTSKQIKNLLEIVNVQEDRIKDERTKIENDLRTRRNVFLNAIEALRKDIDGLEGFESAFMVKDANDQIDQLNERLEILLAEMMDINENEEMLGQNQSDYPRLNQAQMKLKPYEDLWRLVRSFKTNYTSWTRELAVFKLDPEEIEKSTKNMIQVAGSLQKTFRGLQIEKEKQQQSKGVKQKTAQQQVITGPSKLVEEIFVEIMEFQRHVPLLTICCNPGLKERHWEEISKRVGFPISPERDVAFKKLIDAETVKYAPELEEISENASREYEIEKVLTRMRDDIKPLNAELRAWKDTGTFILSGLFVEEVQQILDDQIVKTQAMKNSPYAKIFETKIQQWEEWLDYTMELTDYCVKVQSVWLYLEPVFMSPDIVKHLPTEGTKFRYVDTKWRFVINEIKTNPNLLEFTKSFELLDLLKEANVILEVVQKGLNTYLEGKRSAFPRFYFLSNDELLEILSETKDPQKVQPHLKKCFEGIHLIKLDDNKIVHGMYSSEHEYVPFLVAVDTNAANGKVDQWLLETERAMTTSIRDVIDKSYTEYSRQEREKWVIRRCGQAVLCDSMTYWTNETEVAVTDKALKQYYEKLTQQLDTIVALVRQEISPLDRCTIEALIVLDVHNKDVVSLLIDEQVEKTSDFFWQAQLRYYWTDNIKVRIINAVLEYNYEYLGNSSRLVITPLTDRCYRTLCGAVHLNYGGAPEGPAGTGKTETVKDLAKALARQCVVFNCSDGLDFKAMGKFFKGLATSGAWSCFDEFNRIDLEVLSVVAQQIQTIQLARGQQLEQFLFGDVIITLKHTCNVFITMNPGYAGRSELPDNLKALFRSVAMMVPDYAMIAEISLYSFGFSKARTLARKIVTTYKLCSEQLSSQDHYDYGMRAVKSVLTAAGNLKRKFPYEDEQILTLKAINEVNSAKFLSQDLLLFSGITQDLFPGVVLPQIDYKQMLEIMQEQFYSHKLVPKKYFIDKIIQIYEMVLVRHGLMVVGRPFSGKSSALTILEKTLSVMGERHIQNESKVIIVRLNPKSITMKQLYGQFDDVSYEWTDGVLPVKFRNLVKEDQDTKIFSRKWVIFDGPVDAVWIENMNTVLDDNKKLCLNSGEIIPMGKLMNMIFEPMDLEAASPATVSRCGMIYMEPEILGYEVLYESWVSNLNETDFSEQDKIQFNQLFTFHLTLTLEQIRKVQCISKVQDSGLVSTLLRLLNTLIKDLPPLNQDLKVRQYGIEQRFIFALLQTCGVAVASQYKRNVDKFIKKLCSGDLQPDVKLRRRVLVPDRGSLFDYNFVVKEGKLEGDWVPWITYLDLNEQFSYKLQPQEIFVQTIDSLRYTQLLKIAVNESYPILFCGPTGTGKSSYIKRFLNQLNEQEYLPVEIGFSAQTKAGFVQDIVDSKIDKRRKGGGQIIYCPKEGKLLLFIDDLNMPHKEKYGAQPPIELIRQLIDQGGWYDHKDKLFKVIADALIITAMGPSGGGRAEVTPRLLRHMSLVSVTDFEDEILQRIFSSIMKWFLIGRGFQAEVTKFETKVVLATQDIYKLVVKELLPTPAKSHYLFNLRDFGKIIFGVCQCDKEKVASPEQLSRLWVHEVWRVFGDRLINDDDKLLLLRNIRGVFTKNFNLNFDNIFLFLDTPLSSTGKGDGRIDTLEEIGRLVWSDILAVTSGNQKKNYEEIIDLQYLYTCLEQSLHTLNVMSDKPLELVLFNYAVDHLLTIWRVLRQQGGNALLVGVGGSGKQSLSRLAAKFSNYTVVQIEISRSYDQTQWKEDLKSVLKLSGHKQQQTVFLMDEAQIKEESFLDDINSLLNTFEVPNLFPPDEKVEIIEAIRLQLTKQGDQTIKQASNQQLYLEFVSRVKKHLHLVLAFSPIGDAFRTRMRMFPSLINCCTIDWFQDWPQCALLSVANKFLSTLEMPTDTLDECIKLTAFFHSSTQLQTQTFFTQLKRKLYITPTSFLDIIQLFKQLLTEKRRQNRSDQIKYQTGYQQIIHTEKTVEEMQQNLIKLQPQLKEAALATQQKMVEVQEEKGNADVLKELISVEEKIVQEAVNEANRIKEDCENDLREAMPDLMAAEDALKVLDKKQIEFLKQMKNPPQPVKDVMQALCLIMYPNPTEKKKNPDTLQLDYNWWAASVKLLGNPKLLEEMLKFDRENSDDKLIMNLGKFLNDPEKQKTLDEHVVENASTACKCIIKWVNGIYKFHFVNRKVKPKREALKKSDEKVTMLNSQLYEKSKKLRDAVQNVVRLNQDLMETQRRKAQLEVEYHECSVQLERAKQLIESLGGEKVRWKELADQLAQDQEKLIGDVLLSSGIIAYLGGFTALFRKDITNQWIEKILKHDIPSSQLFSLDKVLGSPVQIRQWQLNGLPSDSFSTSNGIIIHHSQRWPLCIDPQGQANRWIKRTYKNINIIKPSDQDFLRTLENSIQFGKQVLMENVLEELDPSLNPILLKQTTQKGSTLYLKLGDHTIEYSPKFKFYLITKLRNPHYLPQVSVKVALINFMITSEGLADQLLALLVKKERPQLEEQKEQLIIDSANNRKQLQDIEEKILQVLTSDKNILTDEEAIDVLTASKIKSNEIKEKQQIAEITERDIDTARLQYEPFAQEAACLYFGIADLNNIDPMYQYSLNYYTDLFTTSINKAEKGNDVVQRLKKLSTYFLYSLYCNICRGLFEKDKLIFSFLLAIRLLEFKRELDHSELRFFLSGMIPISIKTKPPILADVLQQFLPSKSLNEFAILSQLWSFTMLPNELEENVEEWKEIFDSNSPEERITPVELGRKYNEFQKLCILRALRPDKIVFGVEGFVRSFLGVQYLQPPAFDLMNIYNDSSSTTPLIFILSPGSDPFTTLTNFALTFQGGHQVLSISLGQGQGPIAAKMIKQGITSGEWVVLQNCHLAVTWMSQLEKICEELISEPTHPTFRLWLTSYPSPDFPASILQSGIKITNEPPKGLKANLIGSYMTDPIRDYNFFEGCQMSQSFKKLVFGLCFFHAVIQERKKYGPLGWNIPYEFNESDLRISVRQLKMFLDECSKNIPYEALIYLTAECNYGGRVTDDKDRRLIKTLLNDYYNNNLVDEFMFKLDPMGYYRIPDVDKHADYLSYINKQATHSSPSILGLHQNADITRELAESIELMQAAYISNSELCQDTDSPKLPYTVQTLQTEPDQPQNLDLQLPPKKSVVLQQTPNQFQLLLQSILDEFPQPFDFEAAEQRFPVDYRESMNTVLTQEISRYNILINVIRNSISDMILAEQGKLQMNINLELASRAIQEARVPEIWMEKSYPSQKKLGAYLVDLRRRIQFLEQWYQKGTPKTFWVSGFYFTQSFLTGVLQNYARRKSIPIDEIQFDFEIANNKNVDDEGALINGLFLEGCRWNEITEELDESAPKVLFTECPQILLKPTPVKLIKPPPHYECPVYKTSTRRGVLSTTGHSTNFVLWIRLPTSRPESHWIKRGVALLTQLDD